MLGPGGICNLNVLVKVKVFSCFGSVSAISVATNHPWYRDPSDFPHVKCIAPLARVVDIG